MGLTFFFSFVYLLVKFVFTFMQAIFTILVVKFELSVVSLGLFIIRCSTGDISLFQRFVIPNMP